MKLSDLKIGLRLYACFAMVIAILTVLVIIAYANFSRLEEANRLNIRTYEMIDNVGNILESLINIETGQRGFSLTGNNASLEPLNAGKSAFQKYIDKTRAATRNPKQKERLQKLEEEQRQWMATAIEPALVLRRDVVEGKSNMDAVAAAEQAGKGKQGMDAMRALLSQINQEETTLLEQRLKDADALQSQTKYMLVGGGVVAAILASLLALWLGRNITQPLAAAVTLAKRVAQGDLTARVQVTSKDETGELMQALKDMNEALVRIVAEVRTGTDTIATASGQIASGNMDLSSRTEQQASSLEETASSMEELTSTVKQNAENARQANTLASTASQVAIKGGSVVSQVIDTMGSINESAKKIVDIIGVIDGIAFQTNILALNAAVEAARAGEQGRGFAVVAAEVRNLAQRSAAAAKEIKALIGNSVEKVETGSRLVDQAGSTMNEVVTSVQRVTDIISEIAAASEEQQVGIEQVNQAINQMDQVTQQNASLVEEAAAAAESMQDQSKNLAQVVSVFKLDSTQPASTTPVTRQRHMHTVKSDTPPLLKRSPSKTLAASQAKRVGNSKPSNNDEWDEF